MAIRQSILLLSCLLISACSHPITGLLNRKDVNQSAPRITPTFESRIWKDNGVYAGIDSSKPVPKKFIHLPDMGNKMLKAYGSSKHENFEATMLMTTAGKKHRKIVAVVAARSFKTEDEAQIYRGTAGQFLQEKFRFPPGEKSDTSAKWKFLTADGWRKEYVPQKPGSSPLADFETHGISEHLSYVELDGPHEKDDKFVVAIIYRLSGVDDAADEFAEEELRNMKL